MILDFGFMEGMIKTMKFREKPKYKRHYEAFGLRLKEHYELCERGKKLDGLEPLMVEAYSFMKFLRKDNGVKYSDNPAARPIDIAIMEAVTVLDEPDVACVPPYVEADALECVSYSAWQELKTAGEIRHCKYCQQWLNHPCKKHKEASTIDDMFYCSKCHGWLKTMCVIH